MSSSVVRLWDVVVITGGITLYHITGVMSNCQFLGNEAYQNTSSCNGGTGGGLTVSNSNIILDDPVIEGNMAAWGGGIAVSDSTLRVNGGKISNNLANPINYTNPVRYFGGIGELSTWSVVRSHLATRLSQGTGLGFLQA